MGRKDTLRITCCCADSAAVCDPRGRFPERTADGSVAATPHVVKGRNGQQCVIARSNDQPVRPARRGSSLKISDLMVTGTVFDGKRTRPMSM